VLPLSSVLIFLFIRDSYGHLAVRHLENPEIFIMSRYIPPGTISSPRDLIEYWVKDATPVDPTAAPGYSERCIHSEIFKAYRHINATIHSHSPSVVPFACCGVPLQAIFHMGGHLAAETPIFDIANHYEKGDQQNMLVSNTRFGAALAKCFGDSTGQEKTNVVLMRGHGFTTMAPTIQDCVVRAYYTQENARIQSTAMTLRAGYFAGGSSAQIAEMRYLSGSERNGTKDLSLGSAMRPWTMWVREVEAHPLYTGS